jgi:hypothetical protein
MTMAGRGSPGGWSGRHQLPVIAGGCGSNERCLARAEACAVKLGQPRSGVRGMLLRAMFRPSLELPEPILPHLVLRGFHGRGNSFLRRTVSGQGLFARIWPGSRMLTIPPQTHEHRHMRLRAGRVATSVFGDPGVQGVGKAGMQGMGVNVPRAAVVAAATAGLASDQQSPNEGTFAMGLWSPIFAVGRPKTVGRFPGGTISEDVAVPKLQLKVAPWTTSMGGACWRGNAGECGW